MSIRKVALSLVVGLSMATPAAPVLAQGEIVGGIVGGIIGGAIANSARTRTVYTNRSYSGYSVTTQQNREVQTSLNYFGFPAGVADGVLGQRSRSAISQYQGFVGTPPTGTLTPFERNVLVSAYTRAQSGAPEVMKIMSRDPLGAKAVLRDQYKVMTGGGSQSAGYAGLPSEVSDAIDEIASSSNPSAEQLLQRSGFIQLADLNGDGNNDYILDTSFSGSSFWCSEAQCRSLVFASTPGGYQRNDLLLKAPTADKLQCVGGSCTIAATPAPTAEPETTLASTGSLPSLSNGALPSFSASSGAQRLSSHCGKVSLMTNANGGFTTQENITDVDLVLNEQFCLARTYAIEVGSQAMSSLPGVTPEQVAQICSAYAGAMKEIVSGVSLKPRDAVVQDVSAFILNSGKDPAELSMTARICLGHGYQTDDMQVAMGSTLLLVVLGEAPYGELVGHHLRQGIGASKRVDYADAWYLASLDAIDGGASSVFAPTMGDRPALIRAALGAPTIVADEPAEAETTPVALPTFTPAD